MLKYMEDKFGDRATRGDKSGLQALRNEVKRLEGLVAEQKDKTAGTTDDDKKSDKGSENETDEDLSATTKTTYNLFKNLGRGRLR